MTSCVTSSYGDIFILRMDRCPFVCLQQEAEKTWEETRFWKDWNDSLKCCHWHSKYLYFSSNFFFIFCITFNFSTENACWPLSFPSLRVEGHTCIWTQLQFFMRLTISTVFIDCDSQLWQHFGSNVKAGCTDELKGEKLYDSSFWDKKRERLLYSGYI